MENKKNILNCDHQLDYWEEECSQCDGLRACRDIPCRRTEFFLPMIPPTTTHQTKDVRVVKGKPVIYEPQELKAARVKLQAYLAGYAPEQPYTCPIRLLVKWCFPAGEKHRDGEYKTTRPDTDNLQKLLKDVMTDLGYWRDDALVASEIIEKFWARIPGIYVAIEELEAR